MMNLVTVILLALPGLTASYAQKRERSELYDYLREILRPDADQQLQAGGKLPLGYVCCNYPPTEIPRYNTGKLRAIALSLAKRASSVPGDRYAPLRRVYTEMSRLEQQRQQAQQAPSGLLIPADIPSLPSSSDPQDSRQNSLLNRLLSASSTDPRGPPFSDDVQPLNNPLYYPVDYPSKRGDFVGADGNTPSKTRRHRIHKRTN